MSADWLKPKKATPENKRMLIGIAGAQGSGKTVSALRLAAGLGKRICLIDTENRRSRQYAKNFEFDVIDLDPPFTAERYQEAVEAADAAGYDVIIIDSMSHEHEGMGGALERSEAYLDQKAGNDWAKRDRIKMSSWIKPKGARTMFIMHALQRSRAHIILCFRAKEKVVMAKDSNGKTEIVNSGWQLIGASEYGYEANIFIMLPPGAKGKPDWTQDACRINDMDGELIKLLHNTQQISEDTGQGIARICAAAPLPPPVDAGERAKVEARLNTYLTALEAVTTDEAFAELHEKEGVKQALEWFKKYPDIAAVAKEKSDATFQRLGDMNAGLTTEPQL